MAETFESMLMGGHPNSLGRTVEVVDAVLAAPARFGELFECYRSEDEVVRLRVSNAIKRVEAERHDLLVPFIARFIDEIGALDQPSAQWTLAQLFQRLWADMDEQQRDAAKAIVKRNLATHDDWIVLNASMDALREWSADDTDLRSWLLPHLDRLANDPRKSVASRARKARAQLAS